MPTDPELGLTDREAALLRDWALALATPRCSIERCELTAPESALRLAPVAWLAAPVLR